MQRTVLITGGFGFLGRAVAQKYKELGYRVVGVGHGNCWPSDAVKIGFDSWQDTDVSVTSLMTMQEDPFDVVVHCAGSGTVGESIVNPLQAFRRTVQCTLELLEYLRKTNSQAKLIYPSSAAVYGAKDDAPIKESDSPNPISPYGWHKKIVEDLLAWYSRSYGIDVAIIRYFSIYGPGQMKQLLWDASKKLRSINVDTVVFSGSGEETRDWISIQDAVNLTVAASRSKEKFLIVNGASGKRVTVKIALSLLKEAMGVTTKFAFNGVVREGDPLFYHADITKAMAIGWEPSTELNDGFKQYVEWQAAFDISAK